MRPSVSGILKLQLKRGAAHCLRRRTVHGLASGIEERLQRRLVSRFREAFPDCALHLRGSAARGERMPLVSDIDLAIVIPGDPPERGRERLARLSAFFRPWRTWLRDPWHTIVAEEELPALFRYGRLLDLHEWQPLHGARVALSSADLPLPLVLAAVWNRLTAWTDYVLDEASVRRPSADRLLSLSKKAHALAERVRFFCALADDVSPDDFAGWSRHHAECGRQWHREMLAVHVRVLPERVVQAKETAARNIRRRLSRQPDELVREQSLFRSLFVAWAARLRAHHPLERRNLERTLEEISHLHGALEIRENDPVSPPASDDLASLFAHVQHRSANLSRWIAQVRP